MAGEPTKKSARSRASAGGLRLDREHPWRHQNLGRLLLSSTINWQDILVRGLQEKGFSSFRAAHMNVLRHIDVEGTRLSEIAARSRMSKQAVGQLLSACEKEKLVTLAPDKTDGRAKIVTFTTLGRDVIDAERDVMEQIERELSALLGPAALGGLRDALGALMEWPGPFAKRARAHSQRTRSLPPSAAHAPGSREAPPAPAKRRRPAGTSARRSPVSGG